MFQDGEKNEEKSERISAKVSSTEKKVATLATHRKEFACKLNSVRKELIALQAEHCTIISDQLELRGDGLVRLYIDDVEKCVMELCCELDVIGTVCKLIFHKVDIDSLPCG